MSRKIQLNDFLDNSKSIVLDTESYDNYFMYTFNRRPKTPLGVNSVQNIIPVLDRSFQNTITSSTQYGWYSNVPSQSYSVNEVIFNHRKGYEFQLTQPTTQAAPQMNFMAQVTPGLVNGYKFGIKVYVPQTVIASGTTMRFYMYLVKKSPWSEKVSFFFDFNPAAKTVIGNNTSCLGTEITDLGSGWFYIQAISTGDTTGLVDQVVCRFFIGASPTSASPAGSKIVVSDPELIRNPLMSSFDDYYYNVNVIMLKELFYEDPNTSFPYSPAIAKGNVIAISNDLTTLTGINSYVQNFENLSKFIMQVPSNQTSISTLEAQIRAQSKIYSRKV